MRARLLHRLERSHRSVLAVDADVHDVIGGLHPLAVHLLHARVDALCTKRPLYPGFRGYTTYVA